jgi:pSer/pThr/pTyr-binding forkhead associated (FHA) protein
MTNATKKRYIVRLKLRDREVSQWILDHQSLSIGRSPDNDIIIDNLAISRLHACIEDSPQGPVIRDKGSVNGLEVDGRICSEALIEDGTQVKIGKHTLSFEAEAERRPMSMSASPENCEVTIRATETPRLANPAFLVEQSPEGEVRYPIDTPLFLMGKSEASDVRLDGMLIAEYHVEIKVQGDDHVIAHLAGRRKLRVNGEATVECVLQDDDMIEIAGRTFRFQAPV